MNIFEFCERFHISLAKARKMNKAGVLRLDENTSETITEIRHALSRGQPLTAAQLVELVESPSAVLDLGRYAARAQDELDALGDARGQAAPKLVAAYVTDAAKGDAEAVAVLIGWLKEILPASPVSHSFIAVRLLLGLAPNIRQFDVPRIPRALLNCRRHDAFAGWWHVEKRKSRNVTIYQRPDKKTLANFDL
jgi:hypothetical protein